MKTIVHVNQFAIKRNHKTGERSPVLTGRTYKDHFVGNMFVMRDKNGDEVARFVYSPDKPLPCGARVWFETKKLSIEVVDDTK